MKTEKRTANTTTILVEMPKELSYALSRRVIDLRERGEHCTKAGLLVAFAELVMSETEIKDE